MDSFNILSRALDPFCLGMCLLVLRLYGPTAVAAGFPRVPFDWLVAGIVLGFLAKFIDNTYWAFFWCSSYMGMPYLGWLVYYGPQVLIVQQLTTIAAGLCHVAAFYAMLRQRPQGAANRKRAGRDVVICLAVASACCAAMWGFVLWR
jgi:hypothetical protein